MIESVISQLSPEKRSRGHGSKWVEGVGNPPSFANLTPFPFLHSPMLLRLKLAAPFLGPLPILPPQCLDYQISSPPPSRTPIRIPSANPEPSPLSSPPLTNDAAAADNAVRDVGLADDTARSDDGVLDLHVVQLRRGQVGWPEEVLGGGGVRMGVREVGRLTGLRGKVGGPEEGREGGGRSAGFSG